MEKLLIQIYYQTNTDLANYYGIFSKGKWNIPNYWDKPCEICGAVGCATYHGFYTRHAVDPMTGFSVNDFPVMRFLCNRVGYKFKSVHRTFSLLPSELIPFRKLSLEYMMQSVLIRVKRKLSLFKSLDAISNELCFLSLDIAFVHESALLDHVDIMTLAANRLWKFSELFSEFPGFPSDSDNQILLQFLEYCQNYRSARDESIRGPPGLAWDYYNLNKNHGRFGAFLFGRPSQKRVRSIRI